MANYLRNLLPQSEITDVNSLETAIQACATDNLDLGCMLIEKLAIEKAIRDIDDVRPKPMLRLHLIPSPLTSVSGNRPLHSNLRLAANTGSTANRASHIMIPPRWPEVAIQLRCQNLCA